MLDELITFFSFADSNIRNVALGSVLLGASAAIVGSFTFLKKRALVGDAVAHSVLPGICLAFLIAGNKNPMVLIIGAFITGWLSLVAVDAITRYSKIKEDTAIGLVLSVFFGLGILLLTMIQSSGNAAQAGLNHFLFGNAAAMVGSDLVTFIIISILLILSISVMFKEFALIAFDVNFAYAIGLPVRRLELALTSLTVLAVVTGIQAVGVVLMAAMLITPAAAARYWSDRLTRMVILAALFGGVSGLSGAYISFTSADTPTGPWIVMVISVIAIASFFLAPKKGIIYRSLQQRRIRRQILDENILKAFFQLGERDHNYKQPRTFNQVMNWRHFMPQQLKKGLYRLKRQGFIARKNNQWLFTEAGLNKGRRVVKLHRLWELYLTEYLNIAPDHVHEDAETIEHIITPEVEHQLEELLQRPEKDPHQSTIPYSN